MSNTNNIINASQEARVLAAIEDIKRSLNNLIQIEKELAGLQPTDKVLEAVDQLAAIGEALTALSK